MKLTNEVIHEESPGQRWLRLRHDFRQANQDRIHAQTQEIVIRHAAPARDGWIVRYFQCRVLPETHEMYECEDSTPFSPDFKPIIVPVDLVDELGRHMAEAAAHVLATFSDNVGLDVEDVDGPPIYNLDDEEEILRVIDKMVKEANE